MDSVKKQLRFFKVLVAVLMLIIVAQCSFWLNSFSGSGSSDNTPIDKIKIIHQQGKVIAPVVSGVIDFLNELVSDK